jgi:hypothetical protein
LGLLSEQHTLEALARWFREDAAAHQEQDGAAASPTAGDGADGRRSPEAGGGTGDDPPPRMDDLGFVDFGQEATAMTEVDLLDLFDLFDRHSVGSIGLEEFLVVLQLLAAVESGAYSRFASRHARSLSLMLCRAGVGGPSPFALMQLCALVGVGADSVERHLELSQHPPQQPISDEGQFGRLLFAVFAARERQVAAAAGGGAEGAGAPSSQAAVAGTTLWGGDAAAAAGGGGGGGARKSAASRCGDCGCVVS